MFSCQNVEFLNLGQLTWFENKRKDLNLNLKLNQVAAAVTFGVSHPSHLSKISIQDLKGERF
jgi:hypothetical protein